MAFFNEFPNTRTYDKDLGWLIHVVGQLQIEVKTFIENNTINIPDQITWDITKQYTRNTLVIDYDGTAYLSKQPVPIGIAITNTDYWMPIFNYDDSINSLRANIATNERNNTTATAERHAGDLVWLQDSLYKVTVDMPAGTAYIIGTNVELYTVEDYLLFLKGAIASEAQARQDADTALQGNIDAEVLARQGADSALQEDIDAEVLARQNADNAMQTAIDANKTNYHYFEDFGAVGDGVTDDTQAFVTALASDYTNFKLLAGKTYLVSGNIHITKSNTHITAEENACVKCANNSYTNMFSVFIIEHTPLENVEFDNFTIDGNSQNNIDYGDPDSAGNLPKNYGGRVLAMINITRGTNILIHNMTIKNAWNGGIWLNDCASCSVIDNVFDNCRVHSISIRNNENIVGTSKDIIVSNNRISHSVVGIELIFGVYNIVCDSNKIEYCSDSEKFPAWAFLGTYPNIYPNDARFNTAGQAGYISAAQIGDGAGIEATGSITSATAPPDTSLVYSNNTVWNSANGLRCEELTNDFSITGNNCRDCTGNGIFIFSARRGVIAENVVNYNNVGIRVDKYSVDPSNIIIANNVISGNTTYGADINGHGITINSNGFYDNPTGLVSLKSLDYAIISNNTFYDYFAAGNLIGINAANILTGDLKIIGNDFRVATPISNFNRSILNDCISNINIRSRDYGISHTVDNGGVFEDTVTIDFAETPDTGELLITPITEGLAITIDQITNTSFKVHSNIAGYYNWCIDFAK